MKSLDACQGQLEIFETTFGNEVEITKINWELALAKNLDVGWLVYNMFTESQRDKYEKAKQPEWKKYKKALQPEWEKYLKTTQQEEKKFLNFIQPEWEKYQKFAKPLRDNYKDTINWLIFDILTEED